MELDADSVVDREHIDTAIKFGVELDPTGPVERKKYIVAFFQKLVLQREKLDQGLVMEHLKPEIIKMWQEVISILENSDRKVLDIQSGSVTFQMFCPTKHSLEQLNDEMRIRSLTEKMEKLLKLLGIDFNVKSENCCRTLCAGHQLKLQSEILSSHPE